MFSDVDLTLKKILGDAKAPAGFPGAAQACFLTPEKGYAPAERTINLFLYDVKENRELRDPVTIVERKGADFIRRRPPLRVDCSYLVTAWSPKVKEFKIEEEHQLLGAAFLWLSGFPTIPVQYLTGTLADQPFPPPTLVAQMDGARNTAEFWTALGIPPRPCFNLIVTIAMDLGVEVPEGPPVAKKEIHLNQINAPEANETVVFQIGGTVRDATEHERHIDGVEVLLVEQGTRSTSDKEGQFSFSGLSEGSYKLRVTKQGYTTKTKAIQVPGNSPTAYDIDLSVTS